jgi:hypothetical protein
MGVYDLKYKVRNIYFPEIELLFGNWLSSYPLITKHFASLVEFVWWDESIFLIAKYLNFK